MKFDETTLFPFQRDSVGQVPFVESGSVHLYEKQDTPMEKNEKISEVLVALRNLESSYNQENEHSMRLDINSVKNAHFVANLWPNDIPAPIVDIDEDGFACLYIFGEDDLLRAGIEFFSKKHMATYVVLHSNSENAESGYLDTQTEVIKFFKRYRKHWRK